MQVPFLVRELRFCMLRGAAKEKKKVCRNEKGLMGEWGSGDGPR